MPNSQRPIVLQKPEERWSNQVERGIYFVPGHSESQTTPGKQELEWKKKPREEMTSAHSIQNFKSQSSHGNFVKDVEEEEGRTMEDVKELVVRRAQQILHQQQQHQQQQSVIVNVNHLIQNQNPLYHHHHHHEQQQQHQTLVHNFHQLQQSHHQHHQNQNPNQHSQGLNNIFIQQVEDKEDQEDQEGSPESPLPLAYHHPDNVNEDYNNLHPHLCRMCDKGFPTPARLNRHMKTHLNEEEKPYRCDLCSKSFSAKWNLDRHVKESHEGVKRDRPSRKDDPDRPKRPEEFHKCPICEKAFSHRTSLTRHQRSHNDEKPYECDICEKSFVQASDLDRHRRVHTGEKPFQCNQCDRAFTQSANLSRHLKYHETLKAKKIVYGRDMNLLKDVVDYKKLHDLKKEKGSDDEHETSTSGAHCQEDFDEDEDPLSD